MKGTRPLNNDEIRRVSAAFTGTFEVRNRSLFMIGSEDKLFVARISNKFGYSIIVLKTNGKCSPNMCKAITGDRRRQPSAQQLQTELDCSFDYERWDAVLAALPLSR